MVNNNFIHLIFCVIRSTVLLFLLISSGCATNKRSEVEKSLIEDSKLYQLYIDETGNLLNPASKNKVVNEEEYIGKIISNIEKLKDANPDLTLSIFIHGGLNTFEAATSRVKETKEKVKT